MMTTVDSRFVLASKLAQFFRRNGDKIINGSCKLSLTTSALCLLNSLFIDTLNPDLQPHVELSDCLVNKALEDIKYLYDFMKKTTSLKLFHGMQTLRGGVDLSHFSNLTVLELRKIPAHLIIGLNSLSIQLKALICSRSIYLLKELFGNTIEEQNSTDVWTELKELNLSYNYLENLDSSVRSIPHVEILNLSHNNLKNTDDIQVLKRLCCVNLSYNQLELLPVFNSLSCRHLNKLYIRNNNLENLDGLECLFNLEEFDVGYNLLSEYSALSPLDKLKSLKLLNLEGNPLYFHSQHLWLLCNYINPFALNRGLQINGKFIAIPQNLALHNDNGEETNTGRHQTSINTVVGDIHNVRPPDFESHLLKYTPPLACIASERSNVDENSASSYTSQNSIEQAIATGTKPKRKQRKSKGNKGRIVVISEPEKEPVESKMPEKVNDGSDIPSHVIFKEKFKTRREERGESWLIPDNPFKKLGSDLIVPANTPEQSCLIGCAAISNNAHILPNNKVINEKLIEEFQRLENASTAVNNELKEVLDIESDRASDSEAERKRHISNQSDDIEVLASNLQSSSDGKILSAEDLSDCDFYKKADRGYSTTDMCVGDILSDSEDESEDSILFVERVDNLQKRTISLKIGAKYAKEKDAITGELIDKLDLSSLLSVNRTIQEKDGIKTFEVHMEFHTVKTSHKQRLYLFPDLESADRMCKILQPFADANTLEEATIGALECMNCKSQFSKQVAHRKVLRTKKPLYGKDVMLSNTKEYVQEADACPNCGNHILVELENIPLPSIAAPPQPAENIVNVAYSPGSSSVGSSSSSGYLFSNLLNSFKISPAPKRKVLAGPSNDTVENMDEGPTKASDAIGIYNNEKEYLKHRGSEAQMSRNSSDVTIISNPSQSSISVIPEPGVESNLNTIIERDSQSSLSPPVSHSSAIHSEQDCKIGEKPNGESSILSKEDPDFYSLTESSLGEKEKPFKCSDIVSNDDSDVFHSPYKSVGSSNVQSPKNNDNCDKLMQILGEKEIVTYDLFMQLDHRLKLHIEINILGRDEHISSCLETSIVPLSTGEEFDGVFLLTSKNIYVIKFLAQYAVVLEKNESLEKQVKVLYSGPLSQVKQIKILLGNQGICIGCGPPTHVYMLIIRDVDICNTFCNLISEQIHEKNPTFECVTSAEEMLQLLYESVLITESEEKPEVLLHQFAFKRDKDIVLPICVTLTKEDIFLSKVLYKKQQSCADLTRIQAYFFASSDHQKISDIISLELKLGENCVSVEICFLIESSDVESKSWAIEMQTKSAMFSFISALKVPWEDIFAVPLPLSLKESN